MHVPPGLQLYLAAWVAAVAAFVIAVSRSRSHHGLITAGYRRFLFARWKLATFAAATTVVTVAGHWSGDPTWDDVDSILISTSTFLLAPWSVGVLWRSLRTRRATTRTATAAIAFFIPCWTYDAYILMRDGAYPLTWWSNLMASGSITAMAGMFWNLEWREGVGATFAFSWDPWPDDRPQEFRRLLPVAALISAPVVGIIALFVVNYLLG